MCVCVCARMCTQVKLCSSVLSVVVSSVLEVLLGELPQVLHELVHGGGEAQILIIQPVNHETSIAVYRGEETGPGQSRRDI